MSITLALKPKAKVRRISWMTYRALFKYGRRQDGSYIARYIGERRVIAEAGDRKALIMGLDSLLNQLVRKAA